MLKPTTAWSRAEEGDKSAQQPVGSMQNYAEVPKKTDRITKLNTLYQLASIM